MFRKHLTILGCAAVLMLAVSATQAKADRVSFRFRGGPWSHSVHRGWHRYWGGPSVGFYYAPEPVYVVDGYEEARYYDGPDFWYSNPSFGLRIDLGGDHRYGGRDYDDHYRYRADDYRRDRDRDYRVNEHRYDSGFDRDRRDDHRDRGYSSGDHGYGGRDNGGSYFRSDHGPSGGSDRGPGSQRGGSTYGRGASRDNGTFRNGSGGGAGDSGRGNSGYRGGSSSGTESHNGGGRGSRDGGGRDSGGNRSGRDSDGARP